MTTGDLFAQKPKPKPATVVEMVHNAIDRCIASNTLDKNERTVLDMLRVLWASGEHVSQTQIAKRNPSLGCLHEHEKDVVANPSESTLRKVRYIIRTLRVTHHIPILSDCDGYFLPRTQEEAKAFLTRMEQEVRARAAASFETYSSMKGSLDFLQSNLFEAMTPKGELTNATV